MPKLIPELEKQIIATAEELFVADGFDGVSMRKLAAELNFAVGTLYNYFPNKTELFYSIMEKSWAVTFAEIKALVEGVSHSGPAERRAAAELIYDGIKSRGAFANKTFELSSSSRYAQKLKTHNPQWQQNLLTELAETLAPLGAGFAGSDAERTVQMMLATMRYFIHTTGSEEKRADIDFLMDIIERKE